MHRDGVLIRQGRADDGASWTAVGETRDPHLSRDRMWHSANPPSELSAEMTASPLKTPTLPTHTHASSRSTPGLGRNCFQPACVAHLDLFRIRDQFGISGDLLGCGCCSTVECRTWGGRRCLDTDFPRCTGLLRYRSGLDADARNGSERACPSTCLQR